ncbi:MAG: 6,7-dimethyl-8-ribityllumazine synthase [Muribaculaceae bacterium]|nr:6,7-dimethyl-8-ribityllumazine synthase [Muribaculaceae bacterium]MDE6843355.1 6,7-dimethyl-8-ribityllumazine synthase [Muribaculaceae bacterium]MDE7190005.1 6,7-dimethyl-8-ribityllumazine synthase [Muribaculaceae bacterium]
MSTALHAAAGVAPGLDVKPVSGADFTCAVITASWNSHITHALRDGAVRTFEAAGVSREALHLIDVPGTVELVKAAALAQQTGRYDAIIIIGCVIRGDTPHFDYVCQIAAQGCATLNAAPGAPVVFGVLTVNNEQQALDRAGGQLGNKGSEAAEAAIVMANLAIELGEK